MSRQYTKLLLGGESGPTTIDTESGGNQGIIHTSSVGSNALDEIYISVYSETAQDVDVYLPYFDENNNSKITVSIDPEAGSVDLVAGITISGNDVDGAQVKAFTSSGEATITGYVNRLE
jgi:hypothetical protein